MKALLIVNLVLFLLLAAVSCQPEPEFYIDGQPYYTRTRCIQSHTEVIFDWRYGYDFFTQTYRYSWGPHPVSVCDCYKKDTLQIK